MLQSLQYESNKYAIVNLFKFHFVYEIKKEANKKLYKQSYLVVDSYNNIEKISLLTQILIIEQYSQGLLFSVTPTLRKQRMIIIL